MVAQALREGKRLVTAFWLNDTVQNDRLAPPLQALHFPTPYAEADRPCKALLASLSGFEGDERQVISDANPRKPIDLSLDQSCTRCTFFSDQLLETLG